MKANKYTVKTNGDVTVALFKATMTDEEVQASPAILAYGDDAIATFIEVVEINSRDYMETNGEYLAFENFENFEDDSFDEFDDFGSVSGFY